MTREIDPKKKPTVKPKKRGLNGKPFTAEERENIIRGVEKYMLLGYDLKNACTMARVAYTTVHQWYTKDDTLRIRLDAAKWSVSGKARANLVDAIKLGDLKSSQYWLEKRDRDFVNKEVVVEMDSDKAIDDILSKIYDTEDL